MDVHYPDDCTYYYRYKHLSDIRTEAYLGDGVAVLRAHDGGAAHDGRLQRRALVLGVVAEVPQQQVRHQLVPLDLPVAVCVYLTSEEHR